MQKQPLIRGLASVVLAPLLLLLAGLGGAAAASVLAGFPAVHAGLVSFGIAALLYLVTEELLLEAHEAMEEEHVWWIDVMFFIGFLASFMMEKFSG